MTILGLKNNNQQIAAKVGKPIFINLESNPTTGYNWYRAGYEKLESQSDEILSIKKVYRNSETNLVGAPGVAEFTVTPNKPGSHALHLVYRRVFEPPSENNKRFTINLNVE
ncbi:unnamed protein product [Phytomonas sp. EM1]|nr:unnamed protein product [Phytomonas sp. EM1]|eukprot:CCW62610.1 unnamed protein product [Phytomonas sp. isolate EM1]